jgi:cell division protein FtsL
MRSAKDRLANRKRKKLRGLLLILISTVIVFSALLLRVRLSDRAVELAYEIERLAAERKSLEEENRKLTLEIARLKSPKRISKIAVSDLNMVRAPDAEMVVLEK